MFVDLAFFLTQDRKVANTKNTAKQTQEVSLVTEPLLENLPHATNEATLVVRGRTNPDNKVKLYQNGIFLNSVAADYEGKFEFEAYLEDGKNEFYVRSTDEYSKKTSKSKTYQILYLSEEPVLELANIDDGKRFYNADITIDGRTGKEIFIKINGLPVVVRADGTFSYPLTLKKGENVIKVTAEDTAGNSIEKELKVIYVE